MRIRSILTGIVFLVLSTLASYAGRFDGPWSVTLTSLYGDCFNGSYRIGVDVYGGDIIPPGDVKLTGRVSDKGSVRVNVRHGQMVGGGSGRVNRNGGGGSWATKDGRCGGSWDAIPSGRTSQIERNATPRFPGRYSFQILKTHIGSGQIYKTLLVRS